MQSPAESESSTLSREKFVQQGQISQRFDNKHVINEKLSLANKLTDVAVESMSRVGKQINPQIQKNLVDARLKLQAAEYELLFDKWQLSDVQRAKVYEIIRTREYEIMKGRIDMMTGGGNDINNFLSDKAMSTASNDLQLARILGDQRLSELQTIESKLSRRQQDEAVKIRRSLDD